MGNRKSKPPHIFEKVEPASQPISQEVIQIPTPPPFVLMFSEGDIPATTVEKEEVDTHMVEESANEEIKDKEETLEFKTTGLISPLAEVETPLDQSAFLPQGLSHLSISTENHVLESTEGGIENCLESNDVGEKDEQEAKLEENDDDEQESKVIIEGTCEMLPKISTATSLKAARKSIFDSNPLKLSPLSPPPPPILFTPQFVFDPPVSASSSKSSDTQSAKSSAASVFQAAKAKAATTNLAPSVTSPMVTAKKGLPRRSELSLLVDFLEQEEVAVSRPSTIFETDQERSSFVFPVCGISLDYLRTLQVNPECSLLDICEQIVLPMTEDSHSSFCDFLTADHDLDMYMHVKPLADYFVSYCWSYSWKDLLDCLAEFSGFVWLDLFVINQHEIRLCSPETRWFGSNLHSVVEQVGHVVCCLTEFNGTQNTYFSRAWPCFEVFVSMHCAKTKSVRFPSRVKQALISEIRSGKLTFKEPEDQALSLEAEKDEDLLAILAIFARNPHVEAFDVLVLLKRAVVDQCQHIVNSPLMTAEERANAQFTLGQMLGAIDGETSTCFQALEDAISMYAKLPACSQKLQFAQDLLEAKYML